MNSIRSKVILIIALSLAAAGGLFIFYALSAEREARRHNLAHVRTALLYESEKINNTINLLEQNARHLARLGQYYLHTPDAATKAELKKHLQEQFGRSPETVGGGLWFENPPRYLYVYRNECGDMEVLEPQASRSSNYQNQNWYRQLKAQFTPKTRTVWSSAYIDQGGSCAAMTSVGAPIYTADQQFAGVATVDWRLQSLIEHLNALELSPHSFVLLLDGRNKQIVADTRKKQSGSLKREPFPANAKYWRQQLPALGRSQVAGKKLKLDGVRYYSFGRRLANDLLVLVQIPVAELNELFQYRDLLLLYCGLILVILLPATSLYFLTIWFNRPLTRLLENVEQLGHGDLDTKFELGNNDEISKVGSAFNQMTCDLKKHISNLKKITAEQERIANELKVAQQIQNSILPAWEAPFPANAAFQLDAFLLPARQVGGDLYDFFLLNDHQVALVIGDVSDKGIAPALFMAITQTLHRGLATAPNITPAQLVTRLNQILCRRNKAEFFVTYTFAVVDLARRTLTYCNAGHNPFFHSRWDDDKLTSARRHGLPLGIDSERQYQQSVIDLLPGDTLFFYTDGVTEAQNSEGQFWGTQPVQELLKESNQQHAVPSVIDARLRQKLVNFVGSAPQSDDITVLTFQVGEMTSVPLSQN